MGANGRGIFFSDFVSSGRSLPLAPAFDPDAVHTSPHKSRPLGGLSHFFLVRRRGSRRFCDRFHALHAGSLRIQSPSRRSSYSACAGTRGRISTRKACPYRHRVGAAEKWSRTPSEGGDSPGPSFLFFPFRPPPLLPSPNRLWRTRAHAEVDAAQGGSLSIGLIWSIGWRRGIGRGRL